MSRRIRVAMVCGTPPGAGGLGTQVASAIAALAIDGVELHVFGPAGARSVMDSSPASQIQWHDAPAPVPRWKVQYTWRRWRRGDLVFENDSALGRWAAAEVERLSPDCCYAFTQVGLETLAWAASNGVPTVLESPNGHIRNFRRVYDEESARWCGCGYRGHPSDAMVERVEQEYRLCTRMRLSSEWSRRSMVSHGIAGERIGVFEQPLDLVRFVPSSSPTNTDGPLRVCFVGSLDLRKGFVYLLKAAKLFGAPRIKLDFVGATGDRCSARLLDEESRGLDFRCAPGNPIPGYHAAELFVLPTLEDGSPFAVAEAMASGLAVVVTESCGAAEWVQDGISGWVVPPASAEALASALEQALAQRTHLAEMGRVARIDTECRAGLHCLEPFRKWMFNPIG